MANNTAKIYYNKEGEYLYSGNQKEGDREATQAEIEYWTANGSTIEGDRAKKMKKTHRHIIWHSNHLWYADNIW